MSKLVGLAVRHGEQRERIAGKPSKTHPISGMVINPAHTQLRAQPYSLKAPIELSGIAPNSEITPVLKCLRDLDLKI